MLSVPRLRILRELHLRGTLAQVAEALSYTPSAISQQLSLLEREAGVPLLERVGRGVRLTDAALTLVGHTDAILARLEQAEADLAATQPEVHGTLRVASFQSVVVEIAPSVLTLLDAEYPRLQIEIIQREVDDAYSGLLSHEFDVILGEEFPGLPEPVRPGADRADLVDDPMYLVVPAEGPWACTPETVAELADVPWALDPPDTSAGDWAQRMCHAAGFEPRIRFEGPDPILHAHLVRTGHALAFVPALIAGRDPRGIELFALPGNPRRTLYTAARTGRAHHPAIRAFRDAMARVVAERQPAAPVRQLR
ncbi:LysR family transcriptional regulator [Gordonia desulfuricans]|uniref:LysR family transcriptional regulator n=1 Tax=Gordonia desulfuricans TaxID=89051 RepID=A0A7K3LR42_9ACTN|nr:LysR family transcriptional regulator [Gordonia desulfuricans]NDK90734.1 LysR family transcriptional regulator [Gordonia desulfuricans]